MKWSRSKQIWRCDAIIMLFECEQILKVWTKSENRPCSTTFRRKLDLTPIIWLSGTRPGPVRVQTATSMQAHPQRETRRATIPARYLPRIETSSHPGTSTVHQRLVRTRRNCAKCCWALSPAAALRRTEELKVPPHPVVAVVIATRTIPTVCTSSKLTSISGSPPIWSTSIPPQQIHPLDSIKQTSSTTLPDTKPNLQTKV